MLHQQIAKELAVDVKQVVAAVALLDSGSTVPFIARYRKEATFGLSDTQLRELEDRLHYLREFNARRATIIESIIAQDKMTPALRQAIDSAETKSRLEDLYLPYKPKRRTKAQIAIEKGLLPLAESLLLDRETDPAELAAAYVNTENEVADAAQALEGARHILMERFAESADLLEQLRSFCWQQGILFSEGIPDKMTEGQKFQDYFNFQEPLNQLPSHRILALLRGQKAGVLKLSTGFLLADGEEQCVAMIAEAFAITAPASSMDWLWQSVVWAWKIKLKPKIELDLMSQLREAAEEEAIVVFKDNLSNLLMAAPAGKQVTMGLDPGLRTGVKVVVLDDTGGLQHFTTIFPHVPKKDWQNSLETLAMLCQKYQVNLVSIGNGTGSRETEKLVKEMCSAHPTLTLTPVVVSEAGASVYSASALAASEFPDLDVSFRGAVSIARRLQDPLAELVKIDPKSIGVGQYQHDVNQAKLMRGLNSVIEDCVNAVGADVNTASVPLLKRIAGLNESVATALVTYRDQHGRFKQRAELKKVPKLGEKTYQQAIGFLRIIEGDNPLDASAVHPESYPLVDQLLSESKQTIKTLMGNASLLEAIKVERFVSSEYGALTVRDVITELKKPGRDPRPVFQTPNFKAGIESINDLKSNQKLEGVVTNVTNFGAFVDVGVHQDGLVHISQLADQFVKVPHDVVKVGQIVTVRVLSVDADRKRIQLTMKAKADSAPVQDKSHQSTSRSNRQSASRVPQTKAVKSTGSLGDLLNDALGRS